MNELIGQIIYLMIVHYKITTVLVIAALVIGYTLVWIGYYREIKEWKECHKFRQFSVMHWNGTIRAISEKKNIKSALTNSNQSGLREQKKID